jgi:putative tricarboxylic transport membrane protein
MLGSLLSFLGFVITVRGIVQAGPQVASAKLRPFLMIAAVVGFGILLPYVGLVLAIFVLIVVGAVADTQFRFVEVLVLAAVMSVFCIAVFDWGLGLHIPIWPRGGL